MTPQDIKEHFSVWDEVPFRDEIPNWMEIYKGEHKGQELVFYTVVIHKPLTGERIEACCPYDFKEMEWSKDFKMIKDRFQKAIDENVRKLN